MIELKEKLVEKHIKWSFCVIFMENTASFNRFEMKNLFLSKFFYLLFVFKIIVSVLRFLTHLSIEQTLTMPVVS